MNRKYSFWLSIAAVVISIISMCVVSFRWRPFTFDYLGFFGWTTGALSLLVIILIFGLGFNYFEFRHKIKKMIAKKDKEIESIMEKMNSETKKRLYEQMKLFVDYRKYDEIRRDADEAFKKHEYTKALVKALQSAAIYPKGNIGGVKVELNKESNEIMSFYSNFPAYILSMYYAIKDRGYTDFSKTDLEMIEEYARHIYRNRGEQMPASMDKLIALMENRLSEKK
jgi:uncharacterized membrane protein YgaE (UPF0421/DUF939 family)